MPIVEPTVSVIIPAYNCDRYIVQAVESVLQQEDCSYEIVIIDDGSTDETEKVLQPYRDRLRYVKQENPVSYTHLTLPTNGW
jgi:glycosyltransferase involved in cell wall biosynthesis